MRLGMKDPKVENLEEVKNYFSELQVQQIADQSLFFTEIPHDSFALDILKSNFLSETPLFANDGGRICFSPSELSNCVGSKSLWYRIDEKSISCDSLTIAGIPFLHLDELLIYTETLNGEKLDLETLTKDADYIVLWFWSKFAYKKEFTMLEIHNLLFNDPFVVSGDFKVVPVNCDLLSEWGLKENKKVSIKLKKDSMRVTQLTFPELDDFPWIDN
jgi:hypothetical protein